MPLLAATPVHLSDKERCALEALVRRRSAPQVLVARAHHSVGGGGRWCACHRGQVGARARHGAALAPALVGQCCVIAGPGAADRRTTAGYPAHVHPGAGPLDPRAGLRATAPRGTGTNALDAGGTGRGSHRPWHRRCHLTALHRALPARGRPQGAPHPRLNQHAARCPVRRAVPGCLRDVSAGVGTRRRRHRDTQH